MEAYEPFVLISKEQEDAYKNDSLPERKRIIDMIGKSIRESYHKMEKRDIKEGETNPFGSDPV